MQLPITGEAALKAVGRVLRSTPTIMRALALLIGSMFTFSAAACSCFGPTTFCGTLDPPYPEPQWWIPSDVVMAVVSGQEAYGVDVRIIRVFAGPAQVESTVRVWGDCGALCRLYVTGTAVGDTVVWALQPSDLFGNSICGTELEAEGDYQLSVCGIYALAYASGHVSGPITTEGTTETMDLDALHQLIQGCLSTGVREMTSDPLMVRYGPEGPVLSLGQRTNAALTIRDAMGRACMERNWSGDPLPLPNFPAGIYTVAVLHRDQRWVRRILVH
ncbi:MAG: hypothetical protein KDB84_06105 [Flavobacteriales bacterium]|nr:hypothetical protein [Flavobacteriales bacterium]